jgi:Rrf2 family transcriptional regulator, iron-sulfur cluster assembly transcription factor
MLSQTSEHAVRAVIYLAQQAPGAPISAEQVSTALGAPANYLAKTLNTLAKRGILGSVRGPRGGFWLATPADKLTLAALVRVFDEPRRNPVCLMGGRPCTDAAPCELHFRWKAINEASNEPLERTTLADLLRGRT